MSLSRRVIERVADAEGVDPKALDPPLYDVIDPDALDRLFVDGGTGENGRVVFEYAGYEVHVSTDGQVDLQASPRRSRYA